MIQLEGNKNDKRVKDKLNQANKMLRDTTKNVKRSLQYMEPEREGYLIPDEGEQTSKFSQDVLKNNLPKYNIENIFDLSMPSGPYKVNYSTNGSYSLLAGEQGHLFMMNWKEKTLNFELNLGSKIRNATFLNNDNLLAVSQLKKLYIYDNQGIEVHCLDRFPSPNFLECLPYHFLLACALKNK